MAPKRPPRPRERKPSRNTSTSPVRIGLHSGQAVPLITMHRDLRGCIRNSELSRPFSWRFCSEKNVVINIATEVDAAKVLDMVQAGQDRHTQGPVRVD